LTASSYNLFHTPFLAVDYGTTPESERAANPDSDFLASLEGALRGYDSAVAYAPNQAFIGNLDPRRMPPRPWCSSTAAGTDGGISGNARAADSGANDASVTVAGGAFGALGPFGSILDEARFIALVKFADVFDLVMLGKDFSKLALESLCSDPAMRDADFSRFGDGADAAQLDAAIEAGALPLRTGSGRVGCVKAAHPTDIALSAHTMLENLSSKATAVYALRRLLSDGAIDPASVDYIVECSEEACGDMNQRGGGNFAKSIGELCGLVRATGSDVRSFCAGPVHAIVQAASHVAAGTFGRVVVVAGGATAKLAMNAKKHLGKGLPMLEDCLGSFALLVEADAGKGLVLRNDLVGMHRIGSGSSPQAVIQDLVVDPVVKAGLALRDIDYYAPELQNPEITEAAGAGNVTLSNVKMIAAMAVMRKEISREGIDAFIATHGLTGWAPTQGHIPSGIPALGWFLTWAGRGELTRALVIGKGSLFLGRMTNLFDGMSIVVEAAGRAGSSVTSGDKVGMGGTVGASDAPGESFGMAGTVGASSDSGGTLGQSVPSLPTNLPVRSAADTVSRPIDATLRRSGAHPRSLRLGLTIPGSESGAGELAQAASEALSLDPDLEVVLFGETHGDPELAHREMEKAISEGSVEGALSFHYPFPLGSATVGMLRAPGTGRELFIAATTGAMSADRVEALVLNAIGGIAVAKACGISRPRLGFLNLDGASTALKIIRDLEARGYAVGLTPSRRGDPLLRGNDILSGTVDILVCDSLTGNALMKVLAAYPAGGNIEVLGSGYGPCVGSAGIPVGIISRATSAHVAAQALAYLARSIRGDLPGKYRNEMDMARTAGLGEILAPRPGSPESGVIHPEKKPVTCEIEGIDVLEIERAVGRLASAGIYCEAGMGCTGPVVMVSKEDLREAKALLAKERFI
jgi:betaine reductase